MALEKLFPYVRFLLKKLPRTTIEERLKLDDEVALEYYRLDKTSESHIIMEELAKFELKPPTEAGLRKKKDDDKSPLSEIIMGIYIIFYHLIQEKMLIIQPKEKRIQ